MPIKSLGYRTDIMVRRLSGSILEERDGYLAVRTPSNPGFWWGNFLLMSAAPVAADIAQWESWFTAEFPDAKHRAYGVDSTDGVAGDPAVLAGLGVSSRISAVLTATRLREPARPVLELRTFRDDADWDQLPGLRASVHADDDDQPDPADPDQAAFVVRQVAASRQLVDAGSAEWLGGFDDGRLVAALGIVTDGSGLARYQAVETHPDYRRRGLAGRLVYDAAVLAADRFATETLVILADPDYVAIRLYQSLGFNTAELQVELTRTPKDS